jgi:hypothetical protein
MRRILLAVILPLLVAAASLWNLADFWLSDRLHPAWPVTLIYAFYGAIALIAVFLLFAFTAARAGARLGFLRVLVALVVIAVVGFAPRFVSLRIADAEQAQREPTGADAEMRFQSAYLDRSDDLDARIAAKRPFTAEEALAFLQFAAESDLSWQSLPDHTPETFELVREALDAGILDPNALTTPPVPDSAPRTVALAFYEAEILPNSPHTVERHDWDLLQLLIAHGAETGGPDAARLRTDLARTPSPGSGRYMSLE